MPIYSAIHILYNPNSTGPGKRLATELHRKLVKKYPELAVRLQATKYAGHAEGLAYKWSGESSRPLIISASGDGGYHEVVNGAVRAIIEGKRPITAVVPAGNANDHFHGLGEHDVYESVVKEQLRMIDLIRLTATGTSSDTSRVAHSYIGLGLTPTVGRKLTEAKLNRLVEMWIVLKGLLKLRYVQIRRKGKIVAYDSLTFSNIDRMAKFLQFSQETRLHDGKFEVSAHRHRSRRHFYQYLIRVATHTAEHMTQTDNYSFKTVKRTLVQLDGEVIRLPANSQVDITINPQPLTCIG